MIPELGAEGAARFYVASLLDTLDTVERTGAPRTIFCSPASGANRLRSIGIAEEIVGQGGGDLGRRMQRALERLLSRPGTERAFLLGTDSPDLPVSILRDACRALTSAPAVLAPATDGGFTLVGLRRETLPIWRALSLFEQVPWSEPSTLARTIERFMAIGIVPTILTPWWDVDEPEDLTALRLRLESQRRMGNLRAVRTAAAIEGLLS